MFLSHLEQDSNQIGATREVHLAYCNLAYRNLAYRNLAYRNLAKRNLAYHTAILCHRRSATTAKWLQELVRLLHWRVNSVYLEFYAIALGNLANYRPVLMLLGQFSYL